AVFMESFARSLTLESARGAHTFSWIIMKDRANWAFSHRVEGPFGAESKGNARVGGVAVQGASAGSRESVRSSGMRAADSEEGWRPSAGKWEFLIKRRCVSAGLDAPYVCALVRFGFFFGAAGAKSGASARGSTHPTYAPLRSSGSSSGQRG